MKTPRRSFVVEFKSGRRQSNARASSIWGDTDLRAVAREVEEKAWHLFHSNEAPSTSNAGGAVLSDVINAGATGERASELHVTRAAILSADGAEVDLPKQHPADRLTVESVAQVLESQPSSWPQATSRGGARKRAKPAPARAISHTSMAAPGDQTPQSNTTVGPISLDELAALDAENKRLKRRLAEQLYAQNLRLKKMLERFDVT